MESRPAAALIIPSSPISGAAKAAVVLVVTLLALGAYVHFGPEDKPRASQAAQRVAPVSDIQPANTVVPNEAPPQAVPASRPVARPRVAPIRRPSSSLPPSWPTLRRWTLAWRRGRT